MFKPNKHDNLGVIGSALLQTDLQKSDFGHTPYQSETFPYHLMKNGAFMTVHPNLSTVPQSYGCYIGDHHIFSIGSPLMEASNTLVVFQYPPMMPRDVFDKETQRDLTNLYLAHTHKDNEKRGTINQYTEIKLNLTFPNPSDGHNLFAKQVFALSAVFKMGYLPIEVTENPSETNILVEYAPTNEQVVDKFLDLYLDLPDWVFELLTSGTNQANQPYELPEEALITTGHSVVTTFHQAEQQLSQADLDLVRQSGWVFTVHANDTGAIVERLRELVNTETTE